MNFSYRRLMRCSSKKSIMRVVPSLCVWRSPLMTSQHTAMSIRYVRLLRSYRMFQSTLYRSISRTSAKKTMSFFRFFLRAWEISERTSNATVALMMRFIVVSTLNSS